MYLNLINNHISHTKTLIIVYRLRAIHGPNVQYTGYLEVFGDWVNQKNISNLTFL